MTHKGIPLRLADTAGIRTPQDEAEQEGVSRAKAAMNDADIRIWVIDGSENLTHDDTVISEEIRGSCHVIAINKSDLPLAVTEAAIKEFLPLSCVTVISAATGYGIEELKDLIILSVAGQTSLDEDLNTTERQVEEMEKSLQFLTQTLDGIKSGTGLDAAADSLGQARSGIARILGISAEIPLLEKIFSSFCIGK